MAESYRTNIEDEAGYSVLSISQLPLGNYQMNSLSDFIGYYLANSFSYTIYNKMKSGFYKGYSVDHVIEAISYRYGHMFEDLKNYFNIEDTNIINIKLTVPNFEKDFYIKIAVNIQTPDIDELFKGLKVNKIDKFETSFVKVIALSPDLEEYIADLYIEVMGADKFPQNISDFYYTYIDINNPLKQILKPYTIDVPYIMDNCENIINFAKKDTTDSGTQTNLTSGIEGKTFWEEMIYKAAAIAMYNIDKKLKRKEQIDILMDLKKILEDSEIDDSAVSIIINIFKACIANPYRIIFIYGMNEALTSDKCRERWERIRRLCVRLFRISVYCYN